ncbi:MAG: DUF4054 domain-containing protein [Pigmentiphaga sp.]
MEITAEIVTAFRTYYSEFADTAVWLDADVTRSLEEADDETGARWGVYKHRSIKLRGMFAFAAHRLAMGSLRRSVVENGGLASTPYAVSSKSVADESVSYAVPSPSVAEQIANGDLTLTVYGLEFLRLRKRAGAGALMV